MPILLCPEFAITEYEKCTGFWLENLRGRDRFGDLGVDGRILLKRILKKLGMKMWIGFVRLRMSSIGGFCAYCNKPSGSVKRRGIS
jgi:hypothetical protein